MSTSGVTQELRFTATARQREVSALLLRPTRATALLVFAHGAGAGMRHAFMQATADRLSERGVATLRYQFPYVEHRKSRPDPPPVLIETVRAAVGLAAEHAPELPLLAGGKSMGGRMTSLAAADDGLSTVRGLIFFGFPLHAAGQRGTARAEHLARVSLPMLFLQGTRDALADLTLLRPICAALGNRVLLHEIEGADHGFHVLKRSGRTDAEVLDELADTTGRFVAQATT